MNILEKLIESGSDVFIRDSSGVLTYEEALTQVKRLAQYFSANGIGLGDRVCILGENSRSYILSILALLGISATIVPLNTRASRAEQQDCIKQVKAKAVLLDGSHEIECTGVSKLRINLIPPASTPLIDRSVFDLKNEAFIIYTSGSSGRPKGVSLSLGSVVSAARSSNLNSKFSKADSWLLSVPLFHVSGIGILFRVMLAGGSIVIGSGTGASKIKGDLYQFNVNYISLVGAQLGELISLSQGGKISEHLKVVMLGGGRVPSELVRQCARFHDTIITYGMTESNSHVVATPATRNLTELSNSGVPLTQTKIFIRNISGESCKSGEVGLIAIESESLFDGYLGEEGKLIRREPGPFITSDLGYLGSDGALVVLGRSDRMIKSGGEKIHLDEIESAALRLPYVHQAAAVPIEHSKWGERPKLFLQLKEKGIVNRDIEEIRKDLADQLSAFKIPDQIVVLAQIPQTALGKIDYSQLGAANLH